MNEPSQFGRLLRVLMAKNNLSQDKLANEIDVMPSTLANYISGETVPNMDFLLKCHTRFSMEKGEIADFINAYFFASAKNKKKITFYTQFIDPKRIETLAKALTVLMLYPGAHSLDLDNKLIRELEAEVNGFYRALGKLAEFRLFEN